MNGFFSSILSILPYATNLVTGAWAVYLHLENRRNKIEQRASDLEREHLKRLEERENRVVAREESVSKALMSETQRVRETAIEVEEKYQAQRSMIEQLSLDRLKLELEVARLKQLNEQMEIELKKGKPNGQ